MNHLQIRLLNYAEAVLILIEQNGQNPKLNHLLNQLERSSSSIGANYSEAQSASSTKDFHNKVRIALKEARETEYWLQLLKRRGNRLEKIDKILAETEELIKILVTIVVKTNPKKNYK